MNLTENKNHSFGAAICLIISSILGITSNLYYHYIENSSLAYDSIIYYLLILILGIIIFFKNKNKIIPYLLMFLTIINLYWFIEEYTISFEMIDINRFYDTIPLLLIIISLFYFISPLLLFIQLISNNKNSILSKSWFVSGILETVALGLLVIIYFMLNYTSIDFLSLLITEIPYCIGIVLLGFLIYNTSNNDIINNNIKTLNNNFSESFILLQRRLKLDMLIILIFQIINVGLSLFKNNLNIFIVINLILVSFGYFESKKGTKKAGIIGIIIGILMIISIFNFEIFDFMLGLFILIRSIKYNNEFNKSLNS